MTPDYERLENLAKRFPWVASAYSDCSMLVWSEHRNKIDTRFYFDEVLRNFGNEVKFSNVFSLDNNYLAITIGEWLYFGNKDRLERHSATVLLRRIKWDNILIVGAENEVAEIKVII